MTKTSAKAKPAASAVENLDAKAAEYMRDVPPGVIEIEESIRAQIEAKRKPSVNLYKAILKAQAALPTVRKNGTNPHFKSKYATLDEVWESTRAIINGAGLIVVCDVNNKDGERLLTTRVIHAESGEEISCSFPIQLTGTPQAIGSAMTYARRYTLTALLEIVTGDGADDDGEAATIHGVNVIDKGTSAAASAAASEALGF